MNVRLDDDDDYPDPSDDEFNEYEDEREAQRGTSQCDGLCIPQCSWCMVSHACPDECAGGECPYASLEKEERLRMKQQGKKGLGPLDLFEMITEKVADMRRASEAYLLSAELLDDGGVGDESASYLRGASLALQHAAGRLRDMLNAYADSNDAEMATGQEERADAGLANPQPGKREMTAEELDKEHQHHWVEHTSNESQQ